MITNTFGMYSNTIAITLHILQKVFDYDYEYFEKCNRLPTIMITITFCPGLDLAVVI